MKLKVIVPTYDERETIERLVEGLFAALPEVTIVFVDDDSPDGTAQLAHELAEKHGRIEVIERKGDRGLGGAYRAGFLNAMASGHELIATMDADYSHDPAHLPSMLALIEDCDLVIGSRYVKDGGTVNWALWRVALSWCANTFARTLLGITQSDLTSGFRLYRRELLERIEPERMRSNGYSALVELLFFATRAGARIGEVPIVFHDRTMGESKISKREIYLGALTLFKLRLASLLHRR